MNHAMKRSTRTIPALCLLLGVGAALAGCTVDEPLPPAERPEVAWSDGKPEGPLEDSPWVQAVRASDLERTIGQATRNFSTSRWENAAVDSEMSRQIRYIKEQVAEGELKIPLGPTPMIPVYIDEARDGESADVLMCVAGGWAVTAAEPTLDSEAPGWFTWYTVVREGDQAKVESSGAGEVEGSIYIAGEEVVEPFLDDREDSDCTLDDAKVGLFDPPPDVTVEYGPEDIKVTDSAG